MGYATVMRVSALQMTNGKRNKRKLKHTKKRLAERYGLNFSNNDIRAMCYNKGRVVAYETGGRVVHGFEMGNQEIFVLFDGDNPVTALTREMVERSYL